MNRFETYFEWSAIALLFSAPHMTAIPRAPRERTEASALLVSPLRTTAIMNDVLEERAHRCGDLVPVVGRGRAPIRVLEDALAGGGIKRADALNRLRNARRILRRAEEPGLAFVKEVRNAADGRPDGRRLR